jgi:hypothetical protein
MSRSRRDAQTFLAYGNGGVIDTLDINIMFLQQQITCFFCEFRIPDENRDDVGWVGDHGNVAVAKLFFHGAGVELLKAAVALVFHLVFDSSFGSCHSCGWQGGREDEARGERADRVHHFGAAGDVAANAAVCFAESSSNNVNAIHDCAFRFAVEMSIVVEMLSYASSVWSVHAYRMHFVEKGQGAVFLGQVAYAFNGANRATHAVDGFKGDDFGDIGGEGCKLGFEICKIIMLEHNFLGTAVTNALDHGGMIE